MSSSSQHFMYRYLLFDEFSTCIDHIFHWVKEHILRILQCQLQRLTDTFPLLPRLNQRREPSRVWCRHISRGYYTNLWKWVQTSLACPCKESTDNWRSVGGLQSSPAGGVTRMGETYLKLEAGNFLLMAKSVSRQSKPWKWSYEAGIIYEVGKAWKQRR